MSRIRRVESERDKERLVDELLTKGYEIKQQGQYSAKVKEKYWGSPPVHVFVFIFTFIAAALLFDAANLPAGGAWVVTFLANVTYAIYCRVTAEEIIIKVDDEPERTEPFEQRSG